MAAFFSPAPAETFTAFVAGMLIVSPVRALSFLDKYDVRYIVLGQLEEATYPGPGLDKFPALEGIHCGTVYQAQVTTIYEFFN